MPNYCISTSTEGIALYNNASTTQPLTDSGGFPLYATTSCPAVISEVYYITDNPAQNLFDGMLLFFVACGFITWYFLSRFRLT